MLTAIEFLWAQTPFIPHGHCYLWKPSLVWLHGASDAIIAIAYYLIAFTILYFVQQRQDVPFRGVFWLFAAFIGACGTTHALEIWTLWFPHYWFSGSIKALTAVISLFTAVELIPKIPKALVMPSPLQLEALNQSLAQEIAERKAAQAEIHQLNIDLEERVARRTTQLEQSQQENERLLRQERIFSAELETTLENLQDTAERLNIALSTAQMGTWDWDVEQETQYWSPKTAAILGFPPETVDGDYALWAERVHPDDLARVETAIAYARDQKSVFAEEYRIHHPDHQSPRWVLAQGRFIYTPSGEPRRMLGVIQDTTAQKQSSLALAASEARFRAVFEQAAVGMARLSADGKWQQVNQTLCTLLGYAEVELIGQPFQQFTDPADLAQDDHYYQKLITHQVRSCRFEKRYRHKDGTPIWTMVTVATEQDAEGQVTAFIAIIEDIRKLRQATLELQQRATELEQMNNLLAITNAMLDNRNSELDQFAYVASHDLKAPLRAIANLSEWIEEDLGNDLPEENQHQLSLLRNRVHRMEALINGLLEYSRVGRRERQIEVVDVRQMLSDTIDLLSPPDTFTISLPDTMPHLKTNRSALNQVFANLINNAIKHHDRDDGHIWVTAQTHNDWVEFAVTDDGPGIEPQYHQKIFTIFQTLKARDELESTGIGLAIVKKIIEAEGGQISVESTPGEGTTFRFTWPYQ
jgi:PAS domain S-box-containing protein